MNNNTCCELSYNSIDTKPAICCNISDVNGIYNPVKFGKWLTEAFNRSSFKSWEEVAKAIKPVRGATRSTLSRYAGAKPQQLTSKASQPKPELVIRLANVFGEDVDKVLALAGHASINKSLIPDGLEPVDFEGLNKEDLKELGSFVRYLKFRKNLLSK